MVAVTLFTAYFAVNKTSFHRKPIYSPQFLRSIALNANLFTSIKTNKANPAGWLSWYI